MRSKSIEEIFDELLKRVGGGKGSLAQLKDRVHISAPQLSRLRLGVAPLSEEAIAKISGAFEDDPEFASRLRKDLEFLRTEARIRSQFESEGPAASENDYALQQFDKHFHTTGPNEKRLICTLYREMPQSSLGGKNPEYIQESADMFNESPGLALALFQPFGSVETLDEFSNAAKDPLTEKPAWAYLSDLANRVRNVYRKMLIAVGDPERVKLYESAKVPLLSECGLHSRVFYSENFPAQKNPRIVQLILGKDREYFIEHSTETHFKSVVAAQFSPILEFWRMNEAKLPSNLPADARWKVFTDE